MDIFDDYINYVSEQRYGPLSINDKDMAMQSSEQNTSMPESLQPNIIEKTISGGLQEVKQEFEQKPEQAVYGMAKGAVEGSVGLPGDLISLVKGVYYATQTPEGKSKLDEFIKGAESATGLPTTEDVKMFLDKILPKTEAEASEIVGQILSPAGYVKPTTKAVKITKDMLKAKK